MTTRPRRSTIVLAGVFVLTLGLYLWVRPDPPPRTHLVPAVEVTTTVPALQPTMPSTTTSASTDSTAVDPDPDPDGPTSSTGTAPTNPASTTAPITSGSTSTTPP